MTGKREGQDPEARSQNREQLSKFDSRLPRSSEVGGGSLVTRHSSLVTATRSLPFPTLWGLAHGARSLPPMAFCLPPQGRGWGLEAEGPPVVVQFGVVAASLPRQMAA